MGLPNFLIIGAMRSGTTSLAHYLKAHPDVFMASRKEIHFFNAHWRRGLGWYEEWFAGAGAAAAVGEATPFYMYDPVAVPRMASVVPNARLFVLLRDPVDRAYSHYWQSRELGREPLDFAEVVAVELEQKDTTAQSPYTYLHRGHYVEQLELVCQHYPRQQLGVFRFEDLRDQPAETFSAVCRFLGISDVVPPEVGRPVNGYVKVRSRRLRSIGKRLPSLPQRVLGRFNSMPSDYPPMDPSLRSQLNEYFAPWDEKLKAWFADYKAQAL